MASKKLFKSFESFTLRLAGCAFISAFLYAALAHGVLPTAMSISSTLPSVPPMNMNSTTPPPDLTQDDITRVFGDISPYDEHRTAEQVRANCKSWAVPDHPDEYAKNWYRAATTLQAIPLATPQQHQQMLQLYEGAARKGDYLAVKNLTILYSEGSLVKGGRFRPEPLKAQYWIKYGLERGWLGALEWVTNAMTYGQAGFGGNRVVKMDYLQHAADQGVALAQYTLGIMNQGSGKDMALGDAWLECAAQDKTFSAGLFEWGLTNDVNENPQQALEFYQQAIMAGGRKGAQAAFKLRLAFGGDERTEKALNTLADPIRRQAYKEINEALAPEDNGNIYLRFPRLNEVLPLPSTEAREWKGIYSAMSEDDAAYYQNPPPAEFYLKQVEEAGVLVPLEYISQPSMGMN